MRWPQSLLLVVCVVIGTVLTLVVPRYLLENVLTGAFLTPDLDYPAFLDGAFQPAVATLWLLNIAVLLGWIGFTWSRRPAISRRIRRSRSLWMVLFGLLILAGILLFVAFTALGLEWPGGWSGGGLSDLRHRLSHPHRPSGAEPRGAVLAPESLRHAEELSLRSPPGRDSSGRPLRCSSSPSA